MYVIAFRRPLIPPFSGQKSFGSNIYIHLLLISPICWLFSLKALNVERLECVVIQLFFIVKLTLSVFNQITPPVYKSSLVVPAMWRQYACIIWHGFVLRGMALCYWHNFISYTDFSYELVIPNKKLCNLSAFGLFSVWMYFCALLISNNSNAATWKAQFIVLSAARVKFTHQRTEGNHQLARGPLSKVTN